MLRSQGLRERKNAEVKRALYNAAMDLFREKSFDETSIDEIAERAGYSRATFFNHFGAKQGVLRYYGQEVTDRVEKLIATADTATSPLELIREVVVAMVNEAEEHREELKLIYTYSMRTPDYLFDPTPARKRIFEVFTKLVDDARRYGEIRPDLPAQELALHILFLYQGVVLAIISGTASTESLLHSAWQFILGGVKGDDHSTR